MFFEVKNLQTNKSKQLLSDRLQFRALSLSKRWSIEAAIL